MTMHLLRDLDRIRDRILIMGGLVENQIDKVLRALVNRDVPLAEEVLTGEEGINRMELEIEEDCLKVLALHQPVAGDLRFVVMVMKVNNDLERIADLAENMARRTLYLAHHDPLVMPPDLTLIADTARRMLRESLDALVNQDTGLARSVCGMDDVVDDGNRRMFRIIEERIKENPEVTPFALQYLSVSRQLERIADHATNIAEDVVFLVEGDVIRHREAGPDLGTAVTRAASGEDTESE
jgi:phosphate transport system protein